MKKNRLIIVINFYDMVSNENNTIDNFLSIIKKAKDEGFEDVTLKILDVENIAEKENLSLIDYSLTLELYNKLLNIAKTIDLKILPAIDVKLKNWNYFLDCFKNYNNELMVDLIIDNYEKQDMQLVDLASKWPYRLDINFIFYEIKSEISSEFFSDYSSFSNRNYDISIMSPINENWDKIWKSFVNIQKIYAKNKDYHHIDSLNNLEFMKYYYLSRPIILFLNDNGWQLASYNINRYSIEDISLNDSLVLSELPNTILQKKIRSLTKDKLCMMCEYQQSCIEFQFWETRNHKNSKCNIKNLFLKIKD